MAKAKAMVHKLLQAATNTESALKSLAMPVDRRELATILAALRCYQDSGLQSGGRVFQLPVADIASDGGTLTPLTVTEVDQLCQRLNLGEGTAASVCIQPPEQEQGQQPLFTVVYVIDINADDAQAAADSVHQIMADPASLPPVLDVIDHAGQVTTLDLSRP